MCLILFAYRHHADFPLVVAANRDEFYARPTRNLHFWDESPGLLAGRDLREGGTWMGVTRSGRFAAVTNYREAGGVLNAPRSRGELAAAFLHARTAPEAYLRGVAANASHYGGFNLLIGSGGNLWYFSNRDPAGTPRRLEPGLYGLSNHLLDTPWPKVESGKTELARALDEGVTHGRLLEILRNRARAGDSDLPRTGVSRRLERLLSSRFIRSPFYGTRASTALCVDGGNNVAVTEQVFGRMGLPRGRQVFRFSLPGEAGWTA